MEPSFGGINPEDIKAPERFIIEQALKERMNIPVMHDDQHGTAIICAAGLINALYITGRDIKNVNSRGERRRSAAFAYTELIIAMGADKSCILMCDRNGAIYQAAQRAWTRWKSAHAATDR